ncbi:MAG: phage tail protein [Gammaproteobacteria bacterium]|nr:MAG: phage tail protein [Gammaproteobacteria bacterium]
MKTPVSDQASKIDLIEHLNQDHRDDILLIAQVYADCQHANSVVITDLFEEGVDIAITLDNGEEQPAFVPFQIRGDIEEKLLFLAYTAMAKQGRPLSDSRRHFFSVLDTQMLTPNLLRLTVSSDQPLPEKSPAYAYGFLLKVLEQAPKQPTTQANDQPAKKSRWQQFFDLALLWVMKKLSPKQRQKVIQSMNKGIRYYTLQSAWKSTPDSAFCDRGFIDIFLHGDTAGSQWARSLKAGDIIASRVEHEDKHENLHSGKALLIADETAYPALLGLLECWQNPLPAHVILLGEQAQDQAYFNEDNLHNTDITLHIHCPPEEQGERVIQALPEVPDFTTVWGACEKDAAKAIRMHLRNEWKIKGDENRVKAYWAQQ